jgi:plasmid maintenance system antidote protein VapI
MSEMGGFQPNWSSHPGESAKYALELQGKSVDAFAAEANVTVSEAEQFLTGHVDISNNMAAGLERILGISTRFWLRRHEIYKARKHSIFELDGFAKEWLKGIPLKEIYSLGWVQDSGNPIRDALAFFGVESIESWRARYMGVIGQAFFRTSLSFDSEFGALSTWLRQGEHQAASQICAQWDRAKFEKSLGEIRKLTFKKDPGQFLPALIDICAQSGVAVCIVRSPKGCKASGATRFLRQDLASIMLSFRYLANDHFWFTFFHEAGHLLLHRPDQLFLEGDETRGGKDEEEANEFASNFLIPASHKSDFLRLTNRREAIISFSRKIGIHPGIVVGQLQHAGVLEPGQMNRLKRRYQWKIA